MPIPTNGKTEIIIQFGDQSGNANTVDGGSPSPSAPQQEGMLSKNPVKGKDEKNEGKASAFAVVAYDTVKTLGMQAVNSGISQIGLTTGNYYAQAQSQRTINAAMTGAGLIATAMKNPFMAGVAIAGMAISAGFEMREQNKNREIANYEAQQIAKRIGYSTPRR